MRRWQTGVAGFLVLTGVGAWAGRDSIRSWIYVRQLCQAKGSTANEWVEKVAQLGDAAMPRLLAVFHRDEESACIHAGNALAFISKSWSADDSRKLDLALQLVRIFKEIGPPGKQSVLALEAQLLDGIEKNSSSYLPMIQTGQGLLANADGCSDQGVRREALGLGAKLVALHPAKEILELCRSMAAQSLKDGSPEVRLAALRLAVQPGMNMIPSLLPLIHDSNAEIRCQALVVLSSNPGVMASDALIPFLHDPDQEVRQICETALIGRGLDQTQLKLARLITETQASQRLSLVQHLDQDLDQGVEPWVRKLAQDASPALRVAAIRVAKEENLAALESMIQALAEKDPNPTVRQIAQHYLTSQD